MGQTEILMSTGITISFLPLSLGLEKQMENGELSKIGATENGGLLGIQLEDQWGEEYA